MRRLAACAALALAALQSVHAQAPPLLDDATRQASEAVAAELRAGDVGAVAARFDDAAIAKVSRAQLADSLEQALQRLGAVGRCDRPRGKVNRAGYVAVALTCEVGGALQDLQLAWTQDGRLAGLFFVPTPVAGPAVPLPPGVREEAVTTGAAGWPLPGTLLLPSTSAPAPIAVLVHGSGPNDRDETIGPNKPFRDLAVGLAGRGVATLRYDKRPFVHGARFLNELPDFTLDDEIVDDAVAALATAHARAGTGAVFVVGHSEGAWLAPRIAARAKEAGIPIAGIVLLAGNATPLVDVLLRQITFLAALPTPFATPALVAEMNRQRDDVALLLATGRVQPGHEELPLGLPASAWLDIGRYDPATTLLAQPGLPALLMFGERDYQVPADEKDVWSQRLGTRPDTTFVVLPGIDHLLMDAPGAMGPAQYQVARHVSDAVVDRLARWIAAH